MTVLTTSSLVEFDADGIETSFATGFKFLANDDIVVYLVDAGGVATLKTESVHYTLSGAGDSNGGTVEVLTAPADGLTVRIRRLIDATQPTSFRTQGTFSANVHEIAMDRVVMIAQQAIDTANTAVADVESGIAAIQDSLSASASDLSSALIEATGTEELRTLAERFAEVINVRDFGALGDGSDDTAAVNAAALYAASVGRALYFPAGTYSCNLVLTSGMYVYGDGTLSTTITPESTSSPAVSIGDGTSLVLNVGIDGIRFAGTGSGNSSHGIKINGAYQISIHNCFVEDFGGHNIMVTSTPARPTFFVMISNTHSNRAKGSCYYQDYGSNPAGGSYVTATYLTNCSIIPTLTTLLTPWAPGHVYSANDVVVNGANKYTCTIGGTSAASGGPTGETTAVDNTVTWAWTARVATAMDIRGSWVQATNCWMEVGNYNTTQGHVCISTVAGASAPAIVGSNLILDTDNSANVLVKVNVTDSPKRASAYVRGTASVHGKLMWHDTTTTQLYGKAATIAGGYIVLPEPLVSYRLGFGNNSDEPEDSTDLTYVFRQSDGTGDALYFETTPIRIDGQHTNPLQISGGADNGNKGGAIWEDSNAMLRFITTSRWPGSDSAGNILGLVVAAPASAAATGTPGQIATDGSYFYICTATNTWKRVAIATW